MSNPDKSARFHLKNDPAFKWLGEQLRQRFTPPPPSHCYKTLEEQHKVAGQQQVMEAIHKLLDPND